MIYYIKQKWFQSAQVCVLLILEWGLQAAASLLMIQTFDAIFRLNAHDFLFWTGINLVTWGLYFATSCLREIVQARTIRILNNEVRHDLYRTLLEKSYQDFHKQDSGEYISWLTNDVKQMESLAWKPFFECVGRGAQVCWCILALTSIHWSLVVAAGIISLLMWFVPKVFEKRLERRGKDCSEKQASAVGELKDLLSGFDIFRLFQKEKHFLEQADASSELLEKPSYRLKRAPDHCLWVDGLCECGFPVYHGCFGHVPGLQRQGQRGRFCRCWKPHRRCGNRFGRDYKKSPVLLCRKAIFSENPVPN